MDRQEEFCKWYRDRLYKYLKDDGLIAELAFCLLGIEFRLRQREISMITWGQIDFNNKVIKDVTVSKIFKPDQEGFLSYGDLHMTDDIYLILKQYQTESEDKCGKLFPILNRSIYYKRIQKSIGDITFNGIRLRQIGITLKAAELGGNNVGEKL